MRWNHIPPKVRTELIDSGAAWNTGIAMAQGELVCFAGDYTYYPPTWVEEHWKLYQELGGKATLVGRRQRVKPPALKLWDEVLSAPISIYAEELTSEKVLSFPPSEQETEKLRVEKELDDGRWQVSWRSFLLSANESLPRQLLLDLNGLDEDYDRGFWGHQDEDLALRVAAMNHTFIHDRKACVPVKIEVKNLLGPRENPTAESPLHRLSRKLWALKEGKLNVVARHGIEPDCPREIIPPARDEWSPFDRTPGQVAEAILPTLGGKEGDALYCTADAVGSASGGGAVTLNEGLALKELGLGLKVLSDAELRPQRLGLPDTPFLSDYLALSYLVRTPDRVRLAHFYSGTFSQTVAYLKRQGAIVTYTVPAHDRRVTVEEHERLLGHYPYPHIKDDNLWQMFSQGYREADVVIAPSRLAVDFLEKEGCKKLRVIPHGCDPPERVQPLPEKFIVGYLGQPGVDKGLLYLAQAWASLDYRDAVLDMAGPGMDKSVGAWLGTRVNGGRYRLLGFIVNPSVFFNTCQVLVFPSVCESFGIGILEAMAHGRVVITTRGAGASELIEDGVEGMVVSIRDPSGLAERLQWCRQNPEKLPEMARRAREKALHFTWGHIRQEYISLWRSLA